MKTHVIAFALVSASLAGCAKDTPTETTKAQRDEVAALNGSKIEIVSEGGIAGLAINHVVRHDDRYFLYTRRRLCTTACAATDSASGSLSAAAVDALFNTIAANSPLALEDDYGSMHGAADMMEFTVRVTIGGTTKTIRGDDGTMPEPLHRIVDAVRETISAARK